MFGFIKNNKAEQKEKDNKANGVADPVQGEKANGFKFKTVNELFNINPRKPEDDILIDVEKLMRSGEGGRVFNVVNSNLIDDMAPECIEIAKDHMVIGDDIYFAAIYVSNLPTSMGRQIWRKLLTFSGSIYVSIHCDVVPPHEAAQMLRRESNAIVARQLFRAHNQQRIDSVDNLRTRRVEEARIQTEMVGEPLIYLSITIGIMATSREMLNQKVAEIQRHLKLLGVQAYVAYHQQMEGLTSLLPLGINALHHHHRNVSPATLAQMFPNLSEEVIHPRGFLFGKEVNDSNALVIIDPYELTNPNMVIIGKPGSGKSYLMKSFIEQAVTSGIRAYALDIEGEYLPLAEDLGGLYVDLSINPGTNQSASQINILDIDPSDPEGFQGGYQDFELWVQTLIDLENVKVGNGFSAALNEAYKMAFREKGIIPNDKTTFYRPAPLLSDIVDALAKLRSEQALTNPQLSFSCEAIINALKKYSEGVLAPLFNVESNVQIGMSPFVVFGFKHLDQEKTKLLRIMQSQIWIWNKILSDNSRKLVVIDEAWYFLQHPGTAGVLSAWARRMRKKGAALMIGTQFIDEFERNSSAGTIFNIAETYLYFGASPTAISRLAASGKLTKNESDRLSILRPGEYLLCSSGLRRIVYNIVPQERHMTYTTKPSDRGN